MEQLEQEHSGAAMAEKGVVGIGKVHPNDELTANEAVENRRPTVGEIVMQFFEHLWAIRSTVIMIVVPLALLPIPIVYGRTPPANCAYVILLMIMYWVTEVVPMAVTSFLPIALFPWLMVRSSEAVCSNYLKDILFLFIGGLTFALAIEKSNLHKRVALIVLMKVGSKSFAILFGFMSVTMFLSMWLNNTSATAMMLPITKAVFEALNKTRQTQLTTDKADDETVKKSDKKFTSFKTALQLAIPCAANIGGTGMLIGTGPQIAMMGFLKDSFHKDTEITFASWFAVGIPGMLLNNYLNLMVLMLIFVGPKETFASFKRHKKPEDGEEKVDLIMEAIKHEYEEIGPFSFAEGVIVTSFVFLVTCCFFRAPIFIGGISQHFMGEILNAKGEPKEKAWVTDACIFISICVLLFIFPSRFPNYIWRRKGDDSKYGPSPPILDWKTVQTEMSWNVIVLLGGGFAMADGISQSNLSKEIETALKGLKVTAFPAVIIFGVLTTIVTSFTSNLSTTLIFCPIAKAVAMNNHINPLYLIVTVTLAASLSFVLPISTPPNALVYGTGDIRVIDMLKSGVCMCIVGNAVLYLCMFTYCIPLLNLNEFPAWATAT